MNPNPEVRLIPVRRRPRREWQIPPLETPASLQERQASEVLARAFAQGTTPYGREIFRRLLDLAWRRVEEKKSILEAVREVCEQIAIFPELHSEFVLMLGRILQGEREPLGLSSPPENDFEGTTPWGWATLMVLRARVGQKLNAQRALEANSDETAGE
jgi:hypothetical protein